MAMKLAEAKTELEGILKRHQEEVEAFAAKVREEIVVPICRKHRLKYTAGMGRAYFYPASGKTGVTIGNAWEARNENDGRYSYLAPVFENTLDIEIGKNDVLGYFIEDVN